MHLFHGNVSSILVERLQGANEKGREVHASKSIVRCGLDAAGLGGLTIASPCAEADDLLEFGAYLSSDCTSCHRLEGIHDGIPAIIGWPENDFVRALKSYQSGLRNDAIMGNVARSLAHDESAALARYFSQE